MSALAGFGVEPAELYAAEAMLEEAAQQGRAELARLRACVQDLLGGGWAGAAAAGFGHGWQEWTEGALLVLAALEEMSRALGVSGRGYARSEQAVCLDLERVAP